MVRKSTFFIGVSAATLVPACFEDLKQVDDGNDDTGSSSTTGTSASTSLPTTTAPTTSATVSTTSTTQTTTSTSTSTDDTGTTGPDPTTTAGTDVSTTFVSDSETSGTTGCAIPPPPDPQEPIIVEQAFWPDREHLVVQFNHPIAPVDDVDVSQFHMSYGSAGSVYTCLSSGYYGCYEYGYVDITRYIDLGGDIYQYGLIEYVTILAVDQPDPCDSRVLEITLSSPVPDFVCPRIEGFFAADYPYAGIKLHHTGNSNLQTETGQLLPAFGATWVDWANWFRSYQGALYPEFPQPEVGFFPCPDTVVP